MLLWQRVALIVAALVLLFSLAQFLVSIFPPKTRSTVTPADLGVPYEDVSFRTADGLALAGWFIPAENGTDSTLLVGHGYPFDKGNVLPGALFLRHEHNLFLFDHRSFGESEGRRTTVGLREPEDVRAAVRYLGTRNDSARIGAYGFSLSAATFLMAQDPGIRAIVADSSYADLGLLTEHVYGYLPGPLKLPFVWTTALWSRAFLGVWPSHVSPAEAVAGTEVPVLLIHGTEDSQIPVEHARRIFERAPKDKVELWLVEGADHGGAHAVAGEEYEERVRAFFREHVTPRPRTPA